MYKYYSLNRNHGNTHDTKTYKRQINIFLDKKRKKEEQPIVFFIILHPEKLNILITSTL